MREVLAATLLMLWIVTASPAAGETIVTTLGPGDSFGSVGYIIGTASNTLGSQSIAAMFTMGTETFELESIRLALSMPVPNTFGMQPGAAFSVALVSAPFPDLAAIQFGTVLESWAFSFPPFDLDPHILTATSLDHPLLMAGQTYFVALFPTGPGGVLWHLNDQGATGYAFRQTQISSTSWSRCSPFVTSCVSPAYEVTGTRIAAVPEPATLTLVGAGLAVLYVVRRRHASM